MMLQLENLHPRLVAAAIGLTVFSLSSGGCAPDRELSPSSDPDLVAYPVKLPVVPEKLSADETQLAAAVGRGEAVSFRKISQLLFESFESEQEAQYRAEARVRFAAVLPANLRLQNPPEIKANYERSLGDYFEGQAIRLNSGVTNPLQVLITNQLSSYTGTMLYTLVARELGAAAYRQKNFVVIFTPGQIQPGWIEKSGDDLILYGMNMERDGLGGPENYGPVKNLGGNIVVIDAEVLALVDLFRGRLKEGHECAVREQAIQWTANRYGITVPPAACGSDKSFSRESLARSLFLFGNVANVQGVRARADGTRETDRAGLLSAYK